MEIPPTKADLAQVIKGRDGRFIEIENDVQGVVNSLSRIDKRLRVRWSEAGEYFVVYMQGADGEDGSGDLVTTAQELDGRLYTLVEKLYWKSAQPGYSFADELDEVEDKAKAESERAFEAEHAETFARLAHAMRKDTGRDKSSVFVK